MTSAVEYPGVVTTSNCAEGGSHSLSAGISVTVAVYRIAGRPEMVKFVGPLYAMLARVPFLEAKIALGRGLSRVVVCHDSPVWMHPPMRRKECIGTVFVARQVDWHTRRRSVPIIRTSQDRTFVQVLLSLLIEGSGEEWSW